MKANILIYDDPCKHKDPIDELVVQVLRQNCTGIIASAKSEHEATIKLMEYTFEYMVVHEGGDYKDVDFLKTKSPDSKYIAYSKGVFTGSKPGSIGHMYIEILKRHYDSIIDPVNIEESMVKILQDNNE